MKRMNKRMNDFFRFPSHLSCVYLGVAVGVELRAALQVTFLQDVSNQGNWQGGYIPTISGVCVEVLVLRRKEDR